MKKKHTENELRKRSKEELKRMDCVCVCVCRRTAFAAHTDTHEMRRRCASENTISHRLLVGHIFWYVVGISFERADHKKKDFSISDGRTRAERGTKYSSVYESCWTCCVRVLPTSYECVAMYVRRYNNNKYTDSPIHSHTHTHKHFSPRWEIIRMRQLRIVYYIFCSFSILHLPSLSHHHRHRHHHRMNLIYYSSSALFFVNVWSSRGIACSARRHSTHTPSMYRVQCAHIWVWDTGHSTPTTQSEKLLCFGTRIYYYFCFSFNTHERNIK